MEVVSVRGRRCACVNGVRGVSVRGVWGVRCEDSVVCGCKL